MLIRTFRKTIVLVAMFLIGTMFGYFLFESGLKIPDKYTMPEQLKKPLKQYVVVPLKKFIYRQAEENNPPGDLVPDSLDDRLKAEVKQHID